MKYNFLFLTGPSLLLLSGLYTLTGATCDKYTPSSDVMKQLHSPDRDYDGKPIRMSPAYTCPKGLPNWKYDCFRDTRACAYLVRGMITSHGVTNVTMSENEAEHLFDLVNNEMPKRFGGWKDIFYKMEGCVSGATPIPNFTCLPEGESGYIEAIPTRYCTEGTVSQCSGTGSLKDGMAVLVCGPRVSSIGKSNQIASALYRMIRVNQSEVESLQDNPAWDAESQKFCDQRGKNSATAMLPTPYQMLFGMAVATLMGYEWVF